MCHHSVLIRFSSLPATSMQLSQGKPLTQAQLQLLRQQQLQAASPQIKTVGKPQQVHTQNINCCLFCFCCLNAFSLATPLVCHITMYVIQHKAIKYISSFPPFCDISLWPVKEAEVADDPAAGRSCSSCSSGSAGVVHTAAATGADGTSGSSQPSTNCRRCTQSRSRARRSHRRQLTSCQIGKSSACPFFLVTVYILISKKMISE